MSTDESGLNVDASTRAARWLAPAEIGLILLVFFVHAGWPPPHVNEAHYLAKARHYWNPEWCAGDFFLESADAHQVFYWSVGWLANLLPLATAAWIGRILTWTLLAWAWRRLSRVFCARPFVAVLTAALFVSLVARANLAGEWIVGGVEAKGFAYVFVLLGLEAVFRDRWNRGWLLFGVASAFHVLVGGWAVLACGFVWLTDGSERPPLRSMLGGLAGGLLLALPGLVPALLLTRGVDPDVVREANRIYVFDRLRHHLALHALPMDELLRKLGRSGAMLVALAVLVRMNPASPRRRRVEQFVAASVLFVLVGFAVGLLLADKPETAAGILRYYWFRLFDFAVPLAIALLVGACLCRAPPLRPVVAALLVLLTCGLCAWHLGESGYRRFADPWPPALRLKPETDWLDVCAWANSNTPPGAEFITPRMNQTFKWYAERPEVITRKDIPQDAAGLVEWWQRMEDVHRRDGKNGRKYAGSLAKQGEAVVSAAAEKYGADYVVTVKKPRLDLPVAYENDSFVVYRVRPNGVGGDVRNGE